MTVPIVKQIKNPFCYTEPAGYINPIPEINSDPLNPQKASYEKGFPPLTMPNTPATGRPPEGQDMNGILFEISAMSTWQGVGGGFTYNAADINNSNPFITGYPIGARILRADKQGYWINLVDGNDTDPDNNSTSAGWVPDSVPGFFLITIPTSGTTEVELTVNQAAYDIFILEQGSGVTLTAPLTLIVPEIFSKNYRITNGLPVNVIFKTNNISSPTSTLLPGGNTIISVYNGVNIQDLAFYYLNKPEAAATYAKRPNVGSNNYFALGNGAATAVGTGGGLVNLVQASGQPWIVSNLIVIPFNGQYQINVATKIVVSTVSPDTIELYLRVNGGASIGQDSLTFVNSGTLPLQLNAGAPLSAGDTIELFAIESIASGATVQIEFLNITAIAN